MEYKSSVTELDHFIGSHVYEDMMADFEHWLEGGREKLEQMNDINMICRQQGAVQVMRDVLLWAENFREILVEARE